MGMNALMKKSVAESVGALGEVETDLRRQVRINVAHRKAIHELAVVTMRYQVHNELSSLRESEARLRLNASARR